LAFQLFEPNLLELEVAAILRNFPPPFLLRHLPLHLAPHILRCSLPKLMPILKYFKLFSGQIANSGSQYYMVTGTRTNLELSLQPSSVVIIKATVRAITIMAMVLLVQLFLVRNLFLILLLM
jgi:hypothetical protein